MYAAPDSTRLARPHARSEWPTGVGPRTTARAGGSLALAAVVLLLRGSAMAATSDGSLITNVASATYFQLSNGAVFGVSYAATAAVLIQNPCLYLAKTASPTTQTPGGTVTFTICLVNCSLTGSAFNLTIADRLPDNMSYKAPSVAQWGGFGLWSNYWGTAETATTTSGEPANGALPPLYLRWTVGGIGIGQSACVSYQASIQ